ncbi:DNA (cytosine-5-)-methyltransferase [Bradyrhizobium sp. UFLA03-84]|uniref:DNA cytosine methyltransferase n=1 Tax=Bradyrhizobium sp. UFLA03-84 TaxID=418599 RepID=UPI000BAE5817|nr:DNA cytosine methyltransferase [Bradyrhizobium sp. UFLA03-84]PAY09326.1 DNA (cytosine-5-)-methyltransferase [Bradyrhizobium sp. UFLA03-84]
MGTSVRKSRRQPVFIDAFAGCGGLSLGLLRSGWRGMFAIEKDTFAFDTLKFNLIEPGARLRYDWPNWLEQQPWTIESLMSSHGRRLLALRGQVDLLAGGPPCQGFSSAGRRRQGDPRNSLVERYLEFVELVRPKMVLIENVRGITYDFAGDDDRIPPRNFATELIARLGRRYHVYNDTVRCSEYGVPQQRPRFFLIGMLKSEMRELSSRDAPFARLRSARSRFLAERGLSSRVSCKQAISDFERPHAGIGPCLDSKGYDALLTARPRTAYQRLMRDEFAGAVPDTRLAKHRPDIVERFANIIAECKAAGRLSVQLNREMRDRYGIKKMATRVLDPDKAAPTITSMPDDLLHYSEPRTLTVRENARLQTFPDWFAFQGKYTTGGERRSREVPRFTQVANAVPPLIAEMWGEVLLKYLAAASSDRVAA